MILFAALAMAAGVGAQPNVALPSWTPTPQMVADIEGKLSARLPSPLAQASRNYWVEDRQGRWVVSAQYVWPPSAKPGLTIHATPGGYIMDGGCSVFDAYYDVETATITKAFCGGH